MPGKEADYKNKRGRQEVNEAIRPTSLFSSPEEIKGHVDKVTYNLYRLIWNRFVACQMSPALLDTTTIDVTAGEYILRATGAVVRFPGFMKLYEEGSDDTAQAIEGEEGSVLPSVTVGERLNQLTIEPKQHFTQPPARYTEATLIKELEEKELAGQAHMPLYFQQYRIVNMLRKKGRILSYRTRSPGK